MNFKLYRNIAIISFILFLLILFLLIVKLWNISLDTENFRGSILIVYILLIFICSAVLFISAYFLSDNNYFFKIVSEKVSEERVKLLKELETKEEYSDTEENTNENAADIIKRLIPKGQHKNLESFVQKLFSNISKELELVLGLFYLKNKKSDQYTCIANFAYTREEEPSDFNLGENLNGQVAASKEIVFLDDVPEEYFQTESGLGQSTPKYISMIPIISKNITIAVLELAFFKEPDKIKKEVLINLNENLNEKITKIIES